MLKLYPKPTLDVFIQSCTPLVNIPVLEDEMQRRVKDTASFLSTFEPSDDPLGNLTRFLASPHADFLGVVLSLVNLSQEKFLRILSAERFTVGDYASEWNIDRVQRMLRTDVEFARRVALMFIEGSRNATLKRYVAPFYLEQLALPSAWTALLRDQQTIENVVRRKLQGTYSDKKGEAIETIIRSTLDTITVRYGIAHTKGQVDLVDKEVDHVAPSTSDPFVLIMSSYMETTSSSQTARANEQSAMYLKLQGKFIRHGLRRVFVNFVDGAGWLARRSDLRKLYDGCDYILNLNTLDRLEAIVCNYIPAEYFITMPRPEVEVQNA